MSEKPKASLFFRGIKLLVRLAILLIFAVVISPFVYFYIVRVPTTALADEFAEKIKRCRDDRSAFGIVRRSGVLNMLSIKGVGGFQDVANSVAKSDFEDARSRLRQHFHRQIGEFSHQKLVGCIRGQSCQEFMNTKAFCIGDQSEWQQIVFAIAYNTLKNVGLSN